MLRRILILSLPLAVAFAVGFAMQDANAIGTRMPGRPAVVDNQACCGLPICVGNRCPK